MTRAGNVLIVLAMALCCGALAACASKAEAPGPPSVVETVAPTTDPPVTSTTPSTTQAPTTTIDPAAELAAAVEADFLEAIDALHVGLQDPTNAEKREAALDRFVGGNREFVSARFDEFLANGWALTPNPDVPAAVVVEVPASRVEPSDDVAELQVCEVDSWITVEVGAGPNGSDAVVDPDLSTYRSVFFVRKVDGVWKLEGSSELGRWTGLESCPPQ